MAKQKLHITTTRMLKLIDHLQQSGKASNQGEACKLFGYNYANLSRIKSGDNKFTVEQIEGACKAAEASADYIFGFTNILERKPAKKAVELLRQAVQAVEEELK